MKYAFLSKVIYTIREAVKLKKKLRRLFFCRKKKQWQKSRWRFLVNVHETLYSSLRNIVAPASPASLIFPSRVYIPLQKFSCKSSPFCFFSLNCYLLSSLPRFFIRESIEKLFLSLRCWYKNLLTRNSK